MRERSVVLGLLAGAALGGDRAVVVRHPIRVSSPGEWITRLVVAAFEPAARLVVRMSHGARAVRGRVTVDRGLPSDWVQSM